MKTESQFALIGTWKGWEYDVPASLRRMGLNDLLRLVREVMPNYDQTPEIQAQKVKCNNLLMRETSFNQSLIKRLTEFSGKATVFKEYLDYLSTPEALRQDLEILRSLRIRRLFDLMNSGVLGFSGREAWHQHNKITDLFTNTFSKILRGVNGVNETLEVQSVIVGAGYSVPATTQTALDHQIGGAKVPDDSIYTAYQTTFLTSFITSENNGASTTVSGVTSSSVFDITSATGFSIGDRVEINDQKRTIQNLSGTTVTLDEALTAAPTIGDTFLQIWGETGLLINGDSVLGTRSRIADGGYAKDNTKAIFVESAITVKIVGQ